MIIHININPNLYAKDPQTTGLGRKIIVQSVLIMDEIGLEQFTFRKLAQKIDSTESSIYRYFENKHQLFVYLLNWYWEWIMARIEFNTMNIDTPEKRLRIVLDVIVNNANKHMNMEFLDEDALVRVVVREGAKGYHHKMVEANNQEGFFLAYKRLSEKIAAILLEINPTFPYPRAISTILIDAAQNNIFNAKNITYTFY